MDMFCLPLQSSRMVMVQSPFLVGKKSTAINIVVNKVNVAWANTVDDADQNLETSLGMAGMGQRPFSLGIWVLNGFDLSFFFLLGNIW